VTREICKLCWRVSRVGFHVPDHIWQAVVPAHVVDACVCLDCFTRLADEMRIVWDADIQFFPVSAVTSDTELRAQVENLALALAPGSAAARDGA